MFHWKTFLLQFSNGNEVVKLYFTKLDTPELTLLPQLERIMIALSLRALHEKKKNLKTVTVSISSASWTNSYLPSFIDGRNQPSLSQLNERQSRPSLTQHTDVIVPKNSRSSLLFTAQVQYNYRRWTIELRVDLIEHTLANIHGIYILLEGEGGNRAVNLPSPYFLSQFLPPPYFFEPISTSSLNGYFSFSPFSLLFPPISPSSQLFLGHFSLLPILFLPPPFT